MDWKKIYDERLTTPDEAVKHLKSGMAVFLGHCVGDPTALIEAMIENKEQYEKLELKHMVRLGPVDFQAPGLEKHFVDTPIFAGGNVRAALAEGRADFTPVFFHEVPKQIREGKLECDAAMVMVTPPDEHGYCSLGPGVDYTLQAAKTAPLVIAQINENMPKIYGNSFLHVSEFDHIVEANTPLYEIQPPKITDVEKKIGEYCASLIEDGSTLQLGIGGIPDAVMLFLDDKKDLGIHSEMISDGTLALWEKGVITNNLKSENKGKMIVTFLMGTQKLYDFVDDNPSVEIHPVDYVNHPVTVMRQSKMVSVNSAMQVDLMGQVNAEAIGYKQFSAVGGQVDFIRGVSMGDGGVAIIAMPSVTVKKDGTMISKIVPLLDEGAPVTTSRNDIDYVVTEYGIAALKGKTLRQRARNLIAIAHPDVQDGLKEEFERRFFEKY